MDQILAEARAIIADRRQRLRCTEAVTAEGDMCEPAPAPFVSALWAP